jgi:hypothetical protein
MRNPSEEFVCGLPTLAFQGINSDSAGNYQPIEADSDRQDQNVRKILKAVTISGSSSSNPILYTAKVNFFKHLNTKT